MSEHVIVWEFDRDSITGYVDCEAPGGAGCRLHPVGSVWCNCEQWTVQHDSEGAFHIPEGGDEKHRMADSGECQFTVWMANSDSLAEDNTALDDKFEVGRTPIEPEWQGDFYGWKRATS